METLHNELLTVEVSDLGAELQSIKDDEGKEYLWQGDDRYWGRRSPILFPIVCGLWKGTPKATPIRWDATALHAT